MELSGRDSHLVHAAGADSVTAQVTGVAPGEDAESNFHAQEASLEYYSFNEMLSDSINGH